MYLVYVAMVTLLCCGVCEGRVRARSKDVPACYRDPNYATSLSPCSNPLYSDCGNQLCCGPDHHCCFFESHTACCRIETVTSYELTGIVTGAIAWLGNLIVIFTCIIPHITRKFKRPLQRNKVAPEEDVNAMELHSGKHF